VSAKKSWMFCYLPWSGVWARAADSGLAVPLLLGVGEGTSPQWRGTAEGSGYFLFYCVYDWTIYGHESGSAIGERCNFI
jgi:hypothetical protein